MTSREKGNGGLLLKTGLCHMCGDDSKPVRPPAGRAREVLAEHVRVCTFCTIVVGTLVKKEQRVS
jgi:hypothetical protein